MSFVDKMEAIKRFDKTSIISFLIGIIAPILFFSNFQIFYQSALFLFLTSVLAIILGAISLYRIKKDNSLKGKPFALLGICLGIGILLYFFYWFAVLIDLFSSPSTNFKGKVYEITGQLPLYINFDLNVQYSNGEYLTRIDGRNASLSNYPYGNVFYISELLPAGTKLKVTGTDHDSWNNLDTYEISFKCDKTRVTEYEVPEHECDTYCIFNTNKTHIIQIKCDGTRKVQFSVLSSSCTNTDCIFTDERYLREISSKEF